MKREISEHNSKKGYQYAGPLWTGQLWDKKLVENMYKDCDRYNKKLYDLISVIKEESKINTVGFYDLHKIAKLKSKEVPKIETLLNKNTTRTHFLGWGVRTQLQKLI